MKRLNIDPTRVEMGWIIDFCAQALRNIVIGLGGQGRRLHHAVQVRHRRVLPRSWPFLAVSNDLADMRQRMGQDRRRL